MKPSSYPIGRKLLLTTLVAALISLAAVAEWFYQVLKERAKEQILSEINEEALLIENKLTAVDQSLKAASQSMVFLKSITELSEENIESYLLRLVRTRPPLVMGMTIQQAPFGLIQHREYYSPYMFVEQANNRANDQQVASRLQPPNQDIFFSQLAETDDAPNKDYYKLAFAAVTTWLEPYDWYGTLMATNNAQIVQGGDTLGFVSADINVTDLSAAIAKSVLAEKGHFYLVAPNGTILLHHDEQFLGKPITTDLSLKKVWELRDDQSTSIISTNQDYWATRAIRGSGWYLFAGVPKSVVVNPVLTIAIGGALGAFSLIALSSYIFARRLTKRLQTIVERCSAIMTADSKRSLTDPDASNPNSSEWLSSAWAGGDELKIVERAFDAMTNQLASSLESLELKVQERTQELLTAKEQAVTASESKSRFLASASHELRTPLNGIIGYAQILENSELQDEVQRKGVQVISQCSEHLLKLINEILNISQIESGRANVTISAFDFQSFLDEVVSINRIKAEQKGISFSYTADPSLPLGVMGDAVRIRQVLMNLIGNAVKFTEQGGITFSVSATPKPSQEPNEENLVSLVFSVTDSGSGIAPEDISKLFSPFQQVGDSQRHLEGSGLGLSISKSLAQLMGGSITVDSQLGKGSTFNFLISLSLAKIVPTKAKAKLRVDRITGYQGENKSILITDDNPQNRAFLQCILEPLGFRIYLAEDGLDALSMFKQVQPDLVITDLRMPRMSGQELVETLRNDDITSKYGRVPVIVSSANAFQTDRSQSLNSGADDFVPKPIIIEELLLSVQKLLKLVWKEK